MSSDLGKEERPSKIARTGSFVDDRLGLARSAADLTEQLARVEAAVEQERRLPDELIVNDLEGAARSLCPEIDAALDGVRVAGADRALVAGSGPTVFGVMWGAGVAERARAAAERLSARFPGAVAAEPVGAGFADPVEISA